MHYKFSFLGQTRVADHGTPAASAVARPIAWLVIGGLIACDGPGNSDEVLGSTPAGLGLRPAETAVLSRGPGWGARFFDEALPHTNGRSCATCHVRSEHTTLLPSHVEELLISDPDDPLFNPIDADDPTAANPTYEHLKKGLVRVTLPLADNLDVIDAAGNVITSSDRTIAVWRGVPSVENTAISAPYLVDGRASTLQEQAQGAILGHSQGRVVKDWVLDAIAEFEQSLFTSDRARFVFERFERGADLEDIPNPEAHMRSSAAERRGRKLFKRGCAPCHGGATTDHIIDQELHDAGFFALNEQGFVQFDVQPGKPPVPVHAYHADDDFQQAYTILSYLGQVGVLNAFTSSVELPRYRLRFYSDASRTKVVTELPPPVRTLSGDPADRQPALDERGAPLVGPNLVPQAFSTDPGRAIITGNPLDFEATDVPQLRGIANTAPYFLDNSIATLREVVDIYSRFVIGALPTLDMPAVYPPETPNGLPEALTPAQKDDLMAFLLKL